MYVVVITAVLPLSAPSRSALVSLPITFLCKRPARILITKWQAWTATEIVVQNPESVFFGVEATVQFL